MILQFLPAFGFHLAGHLAAVFLGGAGGRCACRIPARPQLRLCRAAKALGLGDGKIMLRHVLPNAMVATLTFLPFILNGSITTLTSLDFLGFGLPPGSPSLGELLLPGQEQRDRALVGARPVSASSPSCYLY
jgi:hypothetical protein